MLEVVKFNDLIHGYDESHDINAFSRLLIDGAVLLYDGFMSGHPQSTDQMKTQLLHQNPIARFMACAIFIGVLQLKDEDMNLRGTYSELLKAIYADRAQRKGGYNTVIDCEDLIIAKLIAIIGTDVRVYDVCTESIVTAYAPIVPYVGTLRKKFGPVSEAIENPDGRADMDFMVNSLGQLTMSTKFFDIVPYIERVQGIRNITSTDESLDGYLRAIDDKSIDSPDAVRYLTLIFSICHPDIDIDKYREDFKTLHSPETASFESLLSAAGNVFYHVGMESEGYEDDFADFAALKQEVAEKKQHDLGTFDLTPLLNFIYMNRRYRADSYTNTYFSNAPEIRSFTSYRGLLLIEPAINGASADFLYCPLRDDALFIIVILKYWRDGTLEILTEYEFRNEIGVI